MLSVNILFLLHKLYFNAFIDVCCIEFSENFSPLQCGDDYDTPSSDIVAQKS